MAKVVWPESALEILLELPDRERELILEKTKQLERFPRMYPARVSGRFRRCRWFLVTNWIVYYRVVGRTVTIRGLWLSRIP